jgi:phospholipase C
VPPEEHRLQYDSHERGAWKSALLVEQYDQQGGFYDHVPVQKPIPPDRFHYPDEGDFDKTGLRVPAILVSPYVEAGVLTDCFDHTSLLKYLIDKWRLGPLYSRAAVAQTSLERSGGRRATTRRLRSR